MVLMNAALLLLLLLFVVSIMGESSSSRRSSSSSESESIESMVYGGCSRQKYTPNSPYQSNVDSILTSAVNSAAYSSYNNYTITHHQDKDVVYGLYQCRGDLSLAECATCVSRAVAQMSTLCSGTCGGAVQLQGCYLKYDNATFLGVEDKTLVLKNCGPSSEEDSWVDALLTTLSSSSSGQQDGVYRAGASGEVQGVSQCVADLSVGECQDCVSEAIARLRTDCGTSIYAHVYLAKCYVQYSATSAGLNNPNVVDNNNYPPHDDYNIDAGKSSNDEGAKTFAIIIGLLAGVGLLIIFLAFIRKVVAEGHTSNETGK